MSGRSLRKINNEIEELCLYGVEIDDDDQESDIITPVEVDEDALQTALDALEMERLEKVEQIGMFLLNNKYKIEELEQEIRRLREWKSRLDKRCKWLKWYCMSEMIRAGMKKLAGKFINISVSKSRMSTTYPTKPGTKVPIVELIDPEYVIEVVTYKVDADKALRDYKKDKEPIRGFTFHDDNTHLRLK